MGIQSLFDERCHVSGTAYHRFLNEAPYLPRCSDNKTAAVVRPRKYAIRYPYMQVNPKDRVSWLVFDLDHSNSLVWEEVGLPAPNFVVSNRKNGHSHLYYAIVPVCTSENARSKPIQYMKAVYAAMAIRLKADLAYSGPVAKTPGHPWWATWEIHGSEYELGELADYVDLESTPPWRASLDLEEVAHSRHELLFEELRHFAYSIVNNEREEGTYQSFHQRLESFARTKNHFTSKGFTSNLTWSQVKATVKSVARWTWGKYTGSGCHRGVMNLDKSLSLKERQRLAAERTHKARQNATEGKIRAACTLLHEKGERLTLVAVANITRLTRQTIAKYRHLLKEKPQQETSNALSLKVVTHQVLNVKNAVHQISAELCVNHSRSQSNLSKHINKHKICTIGSHKLSDEGARGAKNVFSDICSMLVDIPHVEGVDCPFSFELRGRIARLILRYRLGDAASVSIAISVAAAAADPDKKYFTENQWIGYLVQSLKNAKNLSLESRRRQSTILY